MPRRAKLQEDKPRCIKINKTKKAGQRCEHDALPGQEYCRQHLPDTPEQKAEKELALKIVDQFEAELKQHVPPFIAGLYAEKMRRQITAGRLDRSLVAALVSSAQMPEAEKLEAIQRWARAVHEKLTIPKPLSEITPSSDQRRSGPRLQVQPAELLRMATALPAKDALVAFTMPGGWKNENGAPLISAEHGQTHLQIDCDASVGFGPERAIQQIAQHGPAIAQTFLAMAGIWAERNAGRPRDTYLEVYASDLLRYMGREKTSKDGYHSEDIVAIGRHIYLLKRVTVPKARQVTYARNKKIVQTLSLGNLFVVDELELKRTIDLEGHELQSVVRFRYHMGTEIFEWLCGEQPQYALASGKLLRYHPDRDKYHILLGFCLLYYDRVNRTKAGPRKISLPSLLQLAGLQIPSSNLPPFWRAIQRSLKNLAEDGVVPGLSLKLPEEKHDSRGMIIRNSIRKTMMEAKIEYPMLEIAETRAQRALLPA